MSKKIGLVTHISSKGLTEILTERRSACGGCQTIHGCNTCLASAKIKAKVHNPIGARLGDIVEIQMDDKALWQSALILYGIPLLGLIGGAFAGPNTAILSFARESTTAVTTGLGGFILGIGIALVLGNSAYAKQHLIPSITRVVTPAIPSYSPSE